MVTQVNEATQGASDRDLQLVTQNEDHMNSDHQLCKDAQRGKELLLEFQLSKRKHFLQILNIPATQSQQLSGASTSCRYWISSPLPNHN